MNSGEMSGLLEWKRQQQQQQQQMLGQHGLK